MTQPHFLYPSLRHPRQEGEEGPALRPLFALRFQEKQPHGGQLGLPFDSVSLGASPSESDPGQGLSTGSWVHLEAEQEQ